MKLRPSQVVFALSLALLLAVSTLGAWAWQALDAQQNERLRQARFQFSVAEVRNALNASLQLGVGLQDLPNAQTQIDAAFKQHADVLSMDLADANGQIVFSTDASGLGARVPIAWVARCVAALSAESNDAAQVHGESAEAQWRCAPLVDGIGQVAGVLVLRYGGADAAAARIAEQGAALLSGGSRQSAMWWWLSLGLALAGAVWISKAWRSSDDALAEEAQIATQAALAGSLASDAETALGQWHAKLATAEAQLDAMDGADVG